MDAVSWKAARGGCVVVLALSLLFAGGCGAKAPAEANASLKGALDALAKGDSKGFAAAVLAAQRDTLSGVPEMSSFFEEVKGHEIDNEFDTEVSADSATIMATLYFDDAKKAYSHINFVMKKVEGKWYIDLAKTIDKERKINSVHAFKVWEIEVRKK